MKTTHTTTSRLVLTASAAALCAFTTLSVPIHASPPQYTVTDLGFGFLRGGINDSAQVAFDSSGNHAARWTGAAQESLETVKEVVQDLAQGAQRTQRMVKNPIFATFAPLA